MEQLQYTYCIHCNLVLSFNGSMWSALNVNDALCSSGPDSVHQPAAVIRVKLTEALTDSLKVVNQS
jgi:hypothetical protein